MAGRITDIDKTIFEGKLSPRHLDQDRCSGYRESNLAELWMVRAGEGGHLIGKFDSEGRAMIPSFRVCVPIPGRNPSTGPVRASITGSSTFWSLG